MAIHEHARVRLAIIQKKYGSRLDQGRSGSDLPDRRERFNGDFRRILADILVPAFEAIGDELASSGHACRIERDVGEQTPSIELHVLLRGVPADANNLIRLFSSADAEGDGEVIAEVNVRQTLTELTRFRALSRITQEVAEQMCVDAIEHIFACNAR
ncbi:hypothetical protein WME75_34230 [Sorangium sp. So ce1014]|uniref:hypothetical protein n=1 Tax=Sorangium sp. So ce1014 TaxID=3133326 RepID=UPI003F6083F7